MEKTIKALIGAVVLLSIALFALSPKVHQNIVIDNEDVLQLTDKWDVFVGEQQILQEAILPQKINTNKNETVTISTELPINFHIGVTLAFRSSQQYVKAFIDDTEIYTYGYNISRVYGKSAGSAWHLIRVGEEVSGKRLKIELTSPYKDYSAQLPKVFYGSKSANIFNIVKTNFFSLVACVLIGICGFLLLFFSIFAKKIKINKALWYLSCFSLLSFVWTLMESRLLQLVFNNQLVLLNIAFTSMMLIPVTFFLFMSEIFENINKKLVFSVVATLLSATICVVALQLFNIADFMETIIYYHILLIVCTVVIIIHYISVWKKVKQPEYKYFVYSFFILIIAQIFDTINYYTRIIPDAAYFFRLGLLLFIVSLFSFIWNETYKIFKENIRLNFLESVAFTDVLTNCSNRACFEQDIADNNVFLGAKNLSIVAFDINNLKIVNDTYGHSAGDELILVAATLIRKTFGQDGRLYRLGGDEFVAVSKNLSRLEITHKLLEIEEKAKTAVIECGSVVSVAYGFAMQMEHQQDTVLEIYQKADAKMYKKKVEMKALFGRRKEDTDE